MAQAQIHDVGYRGYDGPRAGLRPVVTALAVHTIQRTLGLKRPIKHKVLPVVALVIAFLPGIVFVGMAAFLPTDLLAEDILPRYSEYLGVIVTGIVVFAALVAPEALCPDRRTGMLSLYLASPLNRDTYLLGKAIGITAVLSLMTTGPQLFLLIAYTVEGAGPGGPADFIELLGRILLSGTLVAVYFTAVTMAISSMSTRRAIASAVTVLVLLISGIATSAVVDADAAPDEVGLLNLLNLPVESAVRILGDAPATERLLQDVAAAAVIGACVAVTLAAAVFTRVRYQRLQVSR